MSGRHGKFRSGMTLETRADTVTKSISKLVSHQSDVFTIISLDTLEPSEGFLLAKTVMHSPSPHLVSMLREFR